ncbi:Wzz/FepE/Etk N-terminal domain-containing protein [Methylophaga thalassica]|uniref:Wzz/FepE/Etk N-terminal domain-containing protein n=1 Tax=Methylophaga thalassica TaxID=40223 RepID=UPI002E7AC55D|nr:Wzz/FepE/Etk N-terminal domain-containing protein [Methylophaga thalassica]WVI84752.1 Wzz/FepE/Etk N-terminal domain-containing protein [Methylophaga thalassica]
MEEEVKGLGDYLNILWRRKYWIIIPAVLLAIATVVVVFSLPATYKSQGTILIESQEIPNDLVRSTVTSYADQRIEVIKQRLMTTSRVMDMVKKYNLYVAERQKTAATSSIVELFKSNVSVDLVQANVTDPVSGRAKRASIAFTVSFMDKSPQKAQQVANELVTEFLNENVKARTDRAAETKDFLKEEGDKFQAKVRELEKQIAEFKDRYSQSLPELLQYNLSMIQRLTDEQNTNQNEILVLKDQVTTLSLQLSTIPSAIPTNMSNANEATTSQQRLEQLRIQYSDLLSKYEPNHPDVLRIKRQIDALEKELGVSGNSREVIQAELDQANIELNTLSEKYAENHPDIKALNSKISSLQERLKTTSSADESTKQLSKNVNPAYVQLQAKIASTEGEIARLKNRQEEIKAKIADFEKRVAETYQVQRAYSELTRDHDNTLAKYRELRSKQLQAELAQNLESENKGESFSLIEPPAVPSKAEKPNRPKLLVLGLGASIGAGLGLAFLVEMFFGGVRGYAQVAYIVGKSPLVVIPMITTTRELARRKILRKRWIIVGIILAIISVIAIHFYVINLEVLWYRLMRKVSLL